MLVVVDDGGAVVTVVVVEPSGRVVDEVDVAPGVDVDVVVVLVDDDDGGAVVVVDAPTVARPDSGTSLPVNRPGSWNDPR